MSNLEQRNAGTQERKHASLHDAIAYRERRGRHFDPGSPVPARLAELEAAVLAGDVRPEHAAIAKTVLCQMQPDRDRNWCTGLLTHARIVELAGCKPRTVRTALERVRQRLPWFNWHKVEGGTALKMGQDGCMTGDNR